MSLSAELAKSKASETLLLSDKARAEDAERSLKTLQEELSQYKALEKTLREENNGLKVRV